MSKKSSMIASVGEISTVKSRIGKKNRIVDSKSADARQMIKDFSEVIIKGDKPKNCNLVWFTLTIPHTNRTEEVHELIEILQAHEQNANCMYHISLLQEIQGEDDEAELSLQRAIELGSQHAKFDLLVKQHEDKGPTEDMFAIDALEMIRHGYRLTRHFNIKYFVYYSQVLQRYATELENKNTVLEAQLLEEQLRPPEVGGSEFEKAKKHFNEGGT